MSVDNDEAWRILRRSLQYIRSLTNIKAPGRLRESIARLDEEALPALWDSFRRVWEQANGEAPSSQPITIESLCRFREHLMTVQQLSITMLEEWQVMERKIEEARTLNATVKDVFERWSE